MRRDRAAVTARVNARKDLTHHLKLTHPPHEQNGGVI